jgi:hypothetical protein
MLTIDRSQIVVAKFGKEYPIRGSGMCFDVIEEIITWKEFPRINNNMDLK